MNVNKIQKLILAGYKEEIAVVVTLRYQNFDFDTFKLSLYINIVL